MDFKLFCEAKDPNKKELEFFKKRKEGARTIAMMAKEKGGPSMLTYWHFIAKDRPYTDVISAIREKKPKSFYVSKYNEIMANLHHTKFHQKNFQQTVGQLEVWGEAISELFG